MCQWLNSQYKNCTSKWWVYFNTLFAHSCSALKLMGHLICMVAKAAKKNYLTDLNGLYLVPYEYGNVSGTKLLLKYLQFHLDQKMN